MIRRSPCRLVRSQKVGIAEVGKFTFLRHFHSLRWLAISPIEDLLSRNPADPFIIGLQKLNHDLEGRCGMRAGEILDLTDDPCPTTWIAALTLFKLSGDVSLSNSISCYSHLLKAFSMPATRPALCSRFSGSVGRNPGVVESSHLRRKPLLTKINPRSPH
jgi:hypothetical protein